MTCLPATLPLSQIAMLIVGRDVTDNGLFLYRNKEPIHITIAGLPILMGPTIRHAILMSTLYWLFLWRVCRRSLSLEHVISKIYRTIQLVIAGLCHASMYKIFAEQNLYRLDKMPANCENSTAWKFPFIYKALQKCLYLSLYLIGRSNVHRHTTLQHIYHFWEDGISSIQLRGKKGISTGFSSYCQLGSEGSTLLQDLNSSSVCGEYIFCLLEWVRGWC